MVIALDGPAGVGKSSVAARIAEALGFHYLNSGNLYRGITYHLLQKSISPENREEVLKEAEKINITLENNRVHLNGSDVEAYLHTDAVDSAVAQVSAFPEIREKVNSILRETGRDQKIVVEGRDMTTVVFPDAIVKVFLDASPEVRAKRRYEQGVSDLSYEEILEGIRKRDEIDRNKKHGSLKVADDALYLDTSYLTIDEVCEKVVNTFHEISRST